MNRETAKKFLPIITAFAEGKVIERKSPDGLWFVNDTPGFFNDPENYRIKPEPREVWINEYHDGSIACYTDEAMARRYACPLTTRKAVRYREVLED